MRFTHIPFSSIILYPDYANSNLYSHTLNGLLLKAFLGITARNTAVNKYFRGVSGRVGNNLNTVIMYLFFHAGIKSFNGRIFFLLPLFI